MPDHVTDAGYARNAAPARFRPHVYERAWTLDRPRGRVWRWLNDPRTFTDSQVWPFRVEFIDEGATRSGMTPGVLNVHHGPLMCLAGVVGDVVPPRSNGEPAYRDLQYLYGSYALSLRLIRPTRLQFWLNHVDANSCRLRLRLDSLVLPRVEPLWTWGQRAFWSRFPSWARQSTR